MKIFIEGNIGSGKSTLIDYLKKELSIKVISEPVKLDQEYRNFDLGSPWEGTQYIKKETNKNEN